MDGQNVALYRPCGVLGLRDVTTRMATTLRFRRSDGLRLAAVLSAVGCSRRYVHHVLSRWDIHEDQIENAALLTSELVTNSVQATGIVEPHPAYSAVYEGVKLIGIRLHEFECSLVIEVWDTSLEPPVLNTPKTDAEHGRGLQLVDALSVRWGFYYARIGGKVIWCELGLAGGKADGGWDRDPETLRRVLEALQALTWDERP